MWIIINRSCGQKYKAQHLKLWLVAIAHTKLVYTNKEATHYWGQKHTTKCHSVLSSAKTGCSYHNCLRQH